MAKPALKTAGISIGGPSAAAVLALIVEQLLNEGIANWQYLLAKFVALGMLVGWAWWTARHPEVETGIDFFDKQDD